MIRKFIFLCMAVLTQHGHAITDYIVTSVHYEPTLPTDGTQLVCRGHHEISPLNFNLYCAILVKNLLEFLCATSFVPCCSCQLSELLIGL